MFKSKLLFWTLEFLLIGILIYVGTKIAFLFNPIVTFVSTLFFPIVISGFLFYLLKPVVTFLINRKLPKVMSIFIIYLVFVGLIGLLIGTGVPSLFKQINHFVEELPVYLKQMDELINNLVRSRWFKWTMEQDYINVKDGINTIQNYVAELPSTLAHGLSSVLAMVKNITVVIVLVPFILFFMLKDGDKLPGAILRFVPRSYHVPSLKVLKETSTTLATYIQGQLLVCMFVGVASFIGYLLIGLPYAFLFALISAVTNIIPYAGPFIGLAPAFFFALIYSPLQSILVIIIVIIVQQLESIILSPLVIGKKLNTHPVTIITLLFVSGNIAGVVGMILAIPTYSVVKTIILNITTFIKLQKIKVNN